MVVPRAWLKERREELGLTQKDLASKAGVKKRTVERWEAGTLTPSSENQHFLADALETPLSKVRRLIAEDRAVIASSSDSGSNRREVVAYGASAVSGVLAKAFAPNVSWLAWQLFSRRQDSLHQSELPPNRKQLIQSPEVLVDEDGYIRFVDEQIVDASAADRIYEEILTGNDIILASAQTSYATDLRLASRAKESSILQSRMQSSMRAGATATHRVNSTGICAKIGSSLSDAVVNVLRSDLEVRSLYLTAVAYRVLSLPWNQAAELSRYAVCTGPLATSWEPERRKNAARALCVELANPSDVGARWCSTVLLGGFKDAAIESVRSSLGYAAQKETSIENLRTIAAVLSDQPQIC